mmetsp:Transcript_11430/g.24640  ORF Transcript_11430/g.24640 Transcript_11430/m.24640 type:complete len:306 (+) Transcript_11430:200-1117(+)
MAGGVAVQRIFLLVDHSTPGWLRAERWLKIKMTQRARSFRRAVRFRDVLQQQLVARHEWSRRRPLITALRAAQFPAPLQTHQRVVLRVRRAAHQNHIVPKRRNPRDHFRDVRDVLFVRTPHMLAFPRKRHQHDRRLLHLAQQQSQRSLRLHAILVRVRFRYARLHRPEVQHVHAAAFRERYRAQVELARRQKQPVDIVAAEAVAHEHDVRRLGEVRLLAIVQHAARKHARLLLQPFVLVVLLALRRVLPEKHRQNVFPNRRQLLLRQRRRSLQVHRQRRNVDPGKRRQSAQLSLLIGRRDGTASS